MNPASILSRAFAGNIRTIAISPAEQADLNAHGISDPTVQRYVLWRKASVLMVIVATLLSALVSTISWYTEPEDQPNVFETVTDNFLKKIKSAVPAADALGKLAEGKLAGAKAAAGEKEEEAEDEGEPSQTAFERFEDGVRLAALYVMPVAALIVLLLGYRFRLSYRVLIAAFAFGFLMPIAFQLCPWSWWGYIEPNLSPTKDPLKYLQNEAEGVMEGLTTLGLLLPPVLSLIPGMQKACLRIKTLLPESLLPGWFIVVTSPLYGLFLFAMFVAVDQVTGDPVILGSIFLIAIAPLVYAFRASAFTKPLLTEEDYQRMRGVQRIVGILTALGGLLLVGYVATREIFGVHFVGQDPKTSLMRPIEVVEYLLEIISRSMFVSVLGADLIMRMNLKAWKESQALAGSEAVATLDGAMAATESIV